MPTISRTLAAAAALSLACIAGCAPGHGKHTSEGLKNSTARVNELKAMNEYQQAEQAFYAGDLDKARKSVDRSETISPNIARIRILKGRIQIEQGDLEGAMDTFQKAEAVDPKCVEAQYYQGILFERFAQSDKALDKFQKAAELEPSNPQYAIASAEMMVDMGKLDEAESYLSGLRTSFEHNAGVRQTLGHLAMMKHEHARAATLFNEARLLAPDDTGILEDLTYAQIATGKFAEAEFNLDRLLKAPANKDRRDLKLMRARCLSEVDRPVEARELLIELTGDSAGQKDAEAWIGLAHSSFVLRDFNRVRMAASRVIALRPDSPEGYMIKAIWQRQVGDLEGAITSLDSAVRFRGERTDPLMLQGMILEDLGQVERARNAYAAVLRQNPEHREAMAALESLASREGEGVTSVPEDSGH
jgi:tetratricopeptide (TPR) repeat protein